MRKLITLFLALGSCALAADQFWMNIPSDPNTADWKMLFPAPAETTIYEDARFAIDILEVKCDGESVRPEVSGLSGYNHPDEIKSRGGSVIYQLLPNRLWTFKTIEPDRYGYEIKQFKIPDSAKVIAVTYLVRFPGGKTSPPMRVTFIASKERPQLLVLPADKK